MMIQLDFLQVELDHQNPNSTLKRRNTEKVVPPRNAHFLCVYLVVTVAGPANNPERHAKELSFSEQGPFKKSK